VKEAAEAARGRVLHGGGLGCSDQGDGGGVVLAVAVGRVEAGLILVGGLEELVLKAREVAVVRRGGWLGGGLLRLRLLTRHGDFLGRTRGCLRLLLLLRWVRALNHCERVILGVVFASCSKRVVLEMLGCLIDPQRALTPHDCGASGHI